MLLAHRTIYATDYFKIVQTPKVNTEEKDHDEIFIIVIYSYEKD